MENVLSEGITNCGQEHYVFTLFRFYTVPYIISYEMIALPSTDCTRPLWVDSSSWEVPCPLLLTRSSVERENGFCFNPHQFMWNSRRFQCSQSQGFTNYADRGLSVFGLNFTNMTPRDPGHLIIQYKYSWKSLKGKPKKVVGNIDFYESCHTQKSLQSTLNVVELLSALKFEFSQVF